MLEINENSSIVVLLFKIHKVTAYYREINHIRMCMHFILCILYIVKI